MQVDIVSDTICPWCYVGKRRFERALDARPNAVTSITWRAFQLNPDMPAEGADRRTYMLRKFGSDARVREIFGAIARAGGAEGIPFAFDAIERTPNTVDSHRLIAFAGTTGHQNAMVDTLFRRYFEDGEDIGDRETLVAAGVEAGLDAEAVRHHLSGTEGFEAVREESEAAQRLGITGVPCFVFEKRYAVSGAQEPEVFTRVMDLIAHDGEDRPEGSATTA